MPDQDMWSLPLLRDVVVAMVDIDRVQDASQDMHIDALTFDLPVELDPIVADGVVNALGTSPPTQIVETSVMPVFHRLRVTLAEGEE